MSKKDLFRLEIEAPTDPNAPSPLQLPPGALEQNNFRRREDHESVTSLHSFSMLPDCINVLPHTESCLSQLPVRPRDRPAAERCSLLRAYATTHPEVKTLVLRFLERFSTQPLSAPMTKEHVVRCARAPEVIRLPVSGQFELVHHIMSILLEVHPEADKARLIVDVLLVSMVTKALVPRPVSHKVPKVPKSCCS